MIGLGIGIGRRHVPFNPTKLFAGGGNGIIWEFPNTTPLFTDSAGATPLTLPDTTIGLVRDGSRVRSPITAYAGVQASAGLRPKYGIGPVSRRNLLTWTEDFTNALWYNFVGLVTRTPTTGPGGATGAYTLTTDTIDGSLWQPAGYGNGTVGTRRVTVKAGTSSVIRLRDTTGGNGAYVDFDLSAGTAGSAVSLGTGGLTVSAISIESLGSGWYRVGYTASRATGNCNFVMAAVGAAGLSISVFQPQCEVGSAATAYQTVTDAVNITQPGFASFGYARFDRSDDVLSTTLTLEQTGDVMVFGRTASKIELGLVYGAGSTFSVGATTVTGMTAGVLASVGDVIAVIAIGRTLTAAEKTAAHNYYTGRGAGALI